MIIAFSGPSGIGKGFIKTQLMANHPTLKEVPWWTTREPRAGEEKCSGNRTHVDVARFAELERTGRCVLVQDLYGSRYGIDRKYLLPCSDVRLTEIHPENVRLAIDLAPDLILIGLVTSDYNFLRERMEKRSDQFSSIEVRLRAARSEIALIKSQRHLFSMVAQISRANDASEEVIQYVTERLSSKGENHA